LYAQESGAPPADQNFFASRWHGKTPLAVMFWRDMLIWSSLLNLATFGVALALLELSYPIWLSLLVYLSPLPWNLFLVVSVWRAADRQGSPFAQAARIASLAWLVVASIL
jgi:hypothetical protein